ncbi:MAG: hypothetical protein H6677_01620 [Candidatus Obscuribacterales bacterium]|nr:hypothetical protein [Candidatus Obscuribacterales bacterium]
MDETSKKSPSKKKKKKGKAPVYLYPLIAGLLILLIGVGVYFYLQWQSGQEEDLSSKPIRILMLGNDYMVTNDIPDMLRQLFKDDTGTRKLEIVSIAIPDSKYDLGMHLASDGFKKLSGKENEWDFVILQDGPEQILEHPYVVLTNIRKIKEAVESPRTRFVLLMPWAKPGEKTRQAVLSAVSRRIARNLSLRVAPAGDIFFELNAAYPDLLLYLDDNRLANINGAWVATAALYNVLRGEQPGPEKLAVTYRYGTESRSAITIPDEDLPDICRLIGAQVELKNRGYRLGLRPARRESVGIMSKVKMQADSADKNSKGSD